MAYEIATIIPLYITGKQHLSLLKSFLESLNRQIEVENRKIFVLNKVDNSIYVDGYNAKDLIGNDYVIQNNINCLSRAWNLGIEKAIELRYEKFYLPNTDIILKDYSLRNAINHLGFGHDFIAMNAHTSMVMFATDNGLNNSIYEVKNHDMSFSSFVMTRFLYNKIGKFDEQFTPAYYEDVDYLNRIKQAGIKAYRVSNAPFYHYTQGTIKTATQLEQNDYFDYLKANKQKYINKWGGDIGFETKL